MVSGYSADIEFFTISWSFDAAFVEALILGLEPQHAEYRHFTARDVGHVFLTSKEEIIDEYRHWLNSTLTYNEDHYYADCIPELRPFLLCCERHRLLRVARMQYLHQIGHFDNHTKNEIDETPDHYQPVEYDHPDDDAMVKLLEHYLAQEYSTPQDYFADYVHHIENADPWQRGLPNCKFWFHGMNHCCSFHLLKSAIYYTLDIWHSHFVWRYNIAFEHHDDGHPYGVGNSVICTAALCARANVDMKSIPWSKAYYSDVPTYVEIYKSDHLLPKVYAYMEQGTVLLLNEDEQTFFDRYARHYGATNAEYLSFLTDLLFSCSPYLQKEGSFYVRLETEAAYADMLEVLERFSDSSPMVRQAKANFAILVKRDEEQSRSRFLVTFPLMALLMEELQ